MIINLLNKHLSNISVHGSMQGLYSGEYFRHQPLGPKAYRSEKNMNVNKTTHVICHLHT